MRYRTIYLLLSTALLFMTVVLPNSMKMCTAALLAISAAVSVHRLKLTLDLKVVLALYALSVVVTLIYLLVGASRGASGVAITQIFIVYVVSPLLWVVLLARFVDVAGQRVVINIFTFLAIAACASVGLYFYLYQRFGSQAVEFFIDTANVNLKDGYVGATMHVYGSLIFLSGAFFSAPEVIKSRPLRYFILAGIFLVAITSGRTALHLAVALGLGLGVVLRKTPVGNVQVHRVGWTARVPLLLLLFGSVIYGLQYLTSIESSRVLEDSYSKIIAGGGDERTLQFRSLLEGIYQSFGFGAGHGVGVELTRSDEYPWRYELVWVATVFRVGIIGAFIYALPFCYYMATMSLRLKRRGLDDFDRMMFSGFAASVVASFTNPYIEAFVFQWMVILPIAAMGVGRSISPASSAMAYRVA